MYKKTVLAIFLGLLTGCGESEIDTVKNSFYNDSETVSMGNLLDNRHICSSVTWDVFGTEQNTNIVEYRCYLSGASDYFTQKLEQKKLARERRNKRELPQAKARLKKRLQERQRVLDEIANLPEIQKSTILQGKGGFWKKEDSLQAELNQINRLIKASESAILSIEAPFEGEMQFKDMYELWQWGFNKDGVPILTYTGFELIKPDGTSKSISQNPSGMFLATKKGSRETEFKEYKTQRGLYNF